MGDIILKNEELPAEHVQDEMITPDPGKTLYITPQTRGFNYPAILDKVLQYVNVNDILAKVEAGTQYVVQIPVEYQEAYKRGELFIMQNQKTGKMWPSLMKIAEDGKNQVVSPLPITEEKLVQGNPVQDLSISYHNQLMQQQMTQLTELVEETYRLVERIEHGQMDDRIGRLEAGKNGLLLALAMPEGNERTMQINSSRQNLLVAQAQIGQTLQRRVTEFDPLPRSSAMRFAKEMAHSGYLASKDKEVNEMQDYYDLYLQSTKLIAASYAISGDLKTAEDSFKIGEQFMQSIDFSKVKSIEYSHKGLRDMFYSRPVDYVSIEKQNCLEEAKNYDYVAIEVSGVKLLEVIDDEREEKISETDSE